jgi:tankyrase
MQNELFEICCERAAEPKDQRRRLIKALQAGADVHATDKNGVTALHHAVRFRSPAAVQTLLEFGANVNQACRRNGSTPLHRAVTQTGAPGTAGMEEAAREIVRLLLGAGADPCLVNKSGKKPEDYTKDEAIRSLLLNQEQSDSCSVFPS